MCEESFSSAHSIVDMIAPSLPLFGDSVDTLSAVAAQIVNNYSSAAGLANGEDAILVYPGAWLSIGGKARV